MKKRKPLLEEVLNALAAYLLLVTALHAFCSWLEIKFADFVPYVVLGLMVDFLFNHRWREIKYHDITVGLKLTPVNKNYFTCSLGELKLQNGKWFAHPEPGKRLGPFEDMFDASMALVKDAIS